MSVPKRVNPSPAGNSFKGGLKSGSIMANPWFRLYSEFAHDPKVQMLSEAMQRRYVMLLCLRCSETLETLHETEIAFQLRLDETQLLETKQLFISKNFIDKHWKITNWDKRQYVSDSSTMRVRKHRGKKKQEGNDDETLQKRSSNAIDTDTDTEQKHNGEATRISQDWFLSKSMGDWATTERPDLDVRKEAQQFKDYWLSQPDDKAYRKDWFAVWRHWIRGCHLPKPNPADNIRRTVPASTDPDPALEKIKEDAKKAAPLPDHIRQAMEVLRKKA